jgi:hypothetical protein
VPRRNLVDPIDRRGRHRHGRRQKLQAAAVRRQLNADLSEVRYRQLCDAKWIGQLQIVAVDPCELFLVEHAGAQPDPVEREALDELVDGHKLRVVCRGSAGSRSG